MKLYLFFIVLTSNFQSALFSSISTNQTFPQLLLVTVATEETDGLKRLQKSAEYFGHKLEIFGLGEEWKGGNMNFEGGAQKIRLLREHLLPYKNNDLYVLFTDAYDVIINANSELILRTFFAFFPDFKILFGAESFCWPDISLAAKYPPIVFGERYLNSGMFIGHINEIIKMLKIAEKHNLADSDDDQLFYTNLYLNENIRNELKIGLDSLAIIFQNLNGAHEFVSIRREKDEQPMIYNSLYNTYPLILHGNGPSKILLNQFENYLMENCLQNEERKNQLNKIKEPSLPSVCIAVFIQKPIPYIEEFLIKISLLDYPKNKIHFYIANNQKYNNEIVNEFGRQWEEFYASFSSINSVEQKEFVVRANSFTWAQEKKAQFLFIVDADAHLNPLALKNLVYKAMYEDNYRGILAPLLIRPNTLFSNFWGAISSNGYYARSTDYVDIIQNNRKGIWNVPFIGNCFLISSNKLALLEKAYTWNLELDSDIAFCHFCRQKGHFLYIDASEDPHFYGYLVNTDEFSQLSDFAQINLELYDFPNNRHLWEHRYLHPDYYEKVRANGTIIEQSCTDVYDFPFLSERFCEELIQIMENFGQWSDGSNKDARLQGGYENVPTRDIHMNQVGLEKQWLKILDEYIAPIQEKVFIGFYQRPIQANMMFVVRYRPEEQPYLRPHHDASTYSIDMALNRRGIDYEGGGVRFIRYNCTVDADKIGWTMLFPGRLTHLHEGLPTTKGTRYILVSFINP